MRESLEEIDYFLDLLRKQAKRKAELYDGTNTMRSVDESLRFAVEELGEIASAVTRNRPVLAKYETIDLAHCAMLIWFALERQCADINFTDLMI